MRRLLRFLAPFLLFPAAPAGAQGTFDLAGPVLTTTVQRGGVTLPIAQVPDLAEGDRIEVAADLPADQSTHYLLVVAFLRGATNPPPKNWFATAETWKPKKARLGVTVPRGATQAIAFLAPDTGGGENAVIQAVRGRPGAFVRAGTDLYQASLDRARLEAFVAGVARVEEAAPERLAQVSPRLASALAIRLNADCLSRPRPAQAACLTQNREGLVLQTGRGSTLADTLTGTPTELAYSIAATREGGAGFYSPYIALARDVARLFGAFRSASYQYIPALAIGSGDRSRLMLNSAPSFQNPKSVLVVPFPPIGGTGAPAMRPATRDALCLTRPGFVLQMEDAPLLFATAYARDLALRLTMTDGATVALPLAADAERGGLVPTQGPGALLGDASIAEAVLTGRWGFDDLAGPRVAVQNGAASTWTPRPDAAVVVGRDHPLSLTGGAASCVDQLSLRDASGGAKPVAFKPGGANEITATLPLQRARPGELALSIAQFGAAPATLTLTAQREASRLDGFTLHAGEPEGELTGARLDQVAELTVAGRRFLPGELTRRGEGDTLSLAPEAPVTAAPDPGVTPGAAPVARVKLRDGRVASVPVVVARPRPRPRVEVVSRDVQAPPGATAARSPLRLPDGLVPPDATLAFSLRVANARLLPTDAVEVATADGAHVATLAAAAGTLQIVGEDIAVGRIRPQDALGAATTGPLRVRLLHDGAAGAWLPLAQIVRLPAIERLSCPRREGDCTLAGTNLFLIAATAPTDDPAAAIPVPAGFVGTKLTVPRPRGDALFLKLHDAPDAMVRVTPGD